MRTPSVNRGGVTNLAKDPLSRCRSNTPAGGLASVFIILSKEVVNLPSAVGIIVKREVISVEPHLG